MGQSFDSNGRGLATQHTRPGNPWSPDPDDDRIPVGPEDTISMHRHGACVVRPRLLIQPQLDIDPLNVLDGRLIELFASKVNGFHKRLFANFFIHQRLRLVIGRLIIASHTVLVMPSMSYLSTLFHYLQYGQVRSSRHA